MGIDILEKAYLEGTLVGDSESCIAATTLPFKNETFFTYPHIIEKLNRFFGSKKDGAAINNYLTWNWFRVIIVGMILKSKPGGISEIIRVLNLDPKYYTNIEKVFYSDAVDLTNVQNTWCEIVKNEFSAYKINDRVLFIGDGVMNPKEGRRSAPVIRLHKESGTQTKPQSFHGLHVGAIDMLSCSLYNGIYSVPLSMKIMQGLKPMAEWPGLNHGDVESSLEAQEFAEFSRIISIFNCDAYYLTDRASMTQNVLELHNELKREYSHKVDIITAAKNNTKCYGVVESDDGSYKMGDIKLSDLISETTGWKKGKVNIYGTIKNIVTVQYSQLTSRLALNVRSWKPRVFSHKILLGPRLDLLWSWLVIGTGQLQNIHYKVHDLMWGKDLRQELRFVICKDYDDLPPFTLVSTDLSLDALTIITLYARRFLCEERYKVFKHVFLGFDMHFWSKSMPWNSFYRKKTDPNPLLSVTSIEEQLAILRSVKAIELYLAFSYIAQGIIIGIAMQYQPGDKLQKLTPKRDKKAVKVSENDVCNFIFRMWDRIKVKYQYDELIRFIVEKQYITDFSEFDDLI